MMWRSSGFRVWTEKDGQIAYMGGGIHATVATRHTVTLVGRMPGSWWLRDMQFDRIELHHDTLGRPDEYVRSRVVLAWDHCRAEDDWALHNVGCIRREDEAVTEIHVTFRGIFDEQSWSTPGQ